MNHDDPHFLSSDEILEARIVAWVLGEASPFEVAELTRVLSEKPALQEFKKRIEAVHGQLGEAISPTASLQLSPERRRDLLAKLGVSPTHSGEPQEAASSINASNTDSAADQEPKKARAPSLVYPIPASRRIFWMKSLSIACSLLLAFLIVKVGFLAPRSRELYRTTVLEEAQKRSGELPDRAAPMTGELAMIDGPKDRKESAAPIALPSSSAEITFSASSPPVAPAKEETDEVALESDQPAKLERFVVTASEDAGGYGASSTFSTQAEARRTFNTGHFDLQRGVGSVLFGSGSPIGIINSSNKTAAFKSSYTVENRFDQYGSLRDFQVPNIVFPQITQDFSMIPGPKSSIRTNYESSALVRGTQAENTVRYYGSLAPTDSVSRRSAFTNSRLWGRGNSLAKSDDTTPSAISFGSAGPAGSPEATALNEGIVLSPFVVDGNMAAGGSASSANSTLAGMLVRTDLRDVASAISVVTQQFLADTSSETRKPSAVEASVKNGPLDAGKVVAKKAISSNVSSPTRSELTAATESVSTFSLHVSDVSFRLAVAAMARGERPDPASIRPEEFYNAFDYGDPAANSAEQVSCRIEQSAHPELQQRNLVRIAVRVPATGRVASQALRLTVLLDTSGSMQRDDRAAAVRRAVQVLVSLLGPADRVTLIGFSRTPRLLAESVPGDHAQTLLKIVAQTPAEGGTNFEEALKLAEQLAQRQHDASAQNRIVLLTDGAANLGNADPAQLAALIVKFRQEGIAFDACGVGTDGVNDDMLEALTRDGDGRYTLLSDADASVDEFAHQLAGAFRPAAKNVKVQIRFNPARVGHYRLIGFEQHRLKTEDFRNDQVDAAELAANEAAIAVYQVEPLPQGEGELGEVFIRFQDAATGRMIERSWTLPYDAHSAAFDRASLTMQLAGAATLVAEKLQGEPVQLEVLRGPINSLRSHYRNEKAVQNLVTLYNELRRATNSK